MERIFQKAQSILPDFVDVPGGVNIPCNITLFDYFEEVKLEGRKHLFSLEVRADSKEKGDGLKAMKNLDLVQLAAQRLVYRYTGIH